MTTLDESKPIKGNDPLWSMMWYQNPDYVDDVTGKKRKDQFNDFNLYFMSWSNSTAYYII